MNNNAIPLFMSCRNEPTLTDLEETHGQITLWEWVRAWLESEHAPDQAARERLLEHLRRMGEPND